MNGAVAGAVFSFAALAGAAAQSTDVPERGLYEIHVGQLAPFVATVLLVRASSRRVLLLPMEPILTAAGLAIDSALGSSGPDPRVRADGVTFVDATRLARALGATLGVDTTALVVYLRRSAPFPAEREALRAAGCCGRAGGPSPPVEAPWSPRTGGGLLAWDVSTTPNADRVYAEGRLGVAVLGGALSIVGFRQTGPLTGATGTSGGSWSYDFVNPASSYLRDIRAGDLLGGAVTGQSFRGLEISNKPPFRTGFFDDVAFEPRVPAGWSYEIYRNGRLVDAVDPAAPHGPTLLPLEYGITPIEVRAYGPAGESITSPLTFITPTEQLPRGRVEYDIAAGRCSFGVCRALAYGTVDAGLANALTVGIGAESWTDSTRRRSTPVGRISFTATPGWQLQADYQPAVLERALATYIGQTLSGSVQGGRTYAQIGQLSALSAVATVSTSTAQWFGTGSFSARSARSSRSSGDALPAWMPSATTATVWLGGDSSRVTGWDSALELLYPRVWVGVRESRDAFASATTTLTATLVRPVDAGMGRHLPVIDIGVGRDRREPFLQAGATIQLDARGSISLSGRRGMSPGINSFAVVTYTTVLRAARVAAQERSSAHARASALVDLSGAIAVTADRTLLVDPTISGNAAGVRGVAYYDENDDGRFDAGDRPAAGARVFVGGQNAVADSAGRFRMWNVLPYAPVEIRVDSLAGIDPAFSLEPGRTLRATPNMFNPIFVRLVRVLDIEGNVELDGLTAPGGIRIVLEGVDGTRRHEALTYADGSYTFAGIFPGDYVLRIASTTLSALGARAEPATLRVATPASSSQPSVAAPLLVLRTKP